MRKLLAFIVRDLRQWASYRLSAFMYLGGVVFSLMIFFFLTEAVALRDPATIAPLADRYFDYLVVGIATSGFVSVSLTGMSSHLREAQMAGTFEALLATPTSPLTVVVGSTIADHVGAALRFLAFLFVAWIIFRVPIAWTGVGAAAAIVLLIITTFTGLGLISAAFITVFKRGDPIATSVAWFSVLLGGVYFPVQSVGDANIEAFAGKLPLTPALASLRRVLLRGESLSDVAPELRSVLVLAVILLPVGLGAFTLAVRRARHTGSLTHY